MLEIAGGIIIAALVLWLLPAILVFAIPVIVILVVSFGILLLFSEVDPTEGFFILFSIIFIIAAYFRWKRSRKAMFSDTIDSPGTVVSLGPRIAAAFILEWFRPARSASQIAAKSTRIQKLRDQYKKRREDEKKKSEDWILRRTVIDEIFNQKQLDKFKSAIKKKMRAFAPGISISFDDDRGGTDVLIGPFMATVSFANGKYTIATNGEHRTSEENDAYSAAKRVRSILAERILLDPEYLSVK